MSRVHIRVQEVVHPRSGASRHFYLEDAPPPNGYAGSHQNVTPSAIDPTDAPVAHFRAMRRGPTLVSDAGDHITKELMGNSCINSALLYAIGQAAGAAQKIPVFLELCCNWAEDFPWEALLEAGGQFLACRPETQIGRLVDGSLPVDRMLDGGDVTRRPVFRLLAVLATGDSAADTEEWNKLYRAKRTADATNDFEMDLDLLVCDAQLHSDIDKVLQSIAGSSRVELIQDKGTVQDAISRRPHAIHFFCHGVKGTGQVPAYLVLQTKGSVGTISNPLTLNAQWLRNEISNNASNHVWQIVLNCCDTAAGGFGGQSIAKELVGSHVPVVVGMSEPIDRNSAHIFSDAYYQELVKKIQNQFPLALQTTVVVEWVEAMYAPRSDLLEDASGMPTSPATASKYKIWTLPIMYSLTQMFKFGTTSLNVSGQVSASTTAAVGAELRAIPGIPPSLARDLQAVSNAAGDTFATVAGPHA